MMKIEQVLHGYHEGHKMLASSVPSLSLSDRRKMSVLSDWDEYVPVQGDDSSYLTCYPLLDSPYYVVAKTWYASEIERPGCVWTHSLLIDLGSMNYFFDFLSLLVLFKRPDKRNIDSFNEPIIIEKAIERERMDLQYDVMPSLNYWLFLLYSHQRPLLLTYQGNALTSQRFVLSLMNHVPKAMLQGMSLCSGSGRLRKFDNDIFDFQLTPESRRSIPNLCGITAGMEKLDGWYDNIAQSVLQEGVDVPMLLARFSEEIGSNIDALAAVVMVYTRLDKLKSPGEENTTKFMLILRIMSTAFPNPDDGRYFKEVILSEDVIKFFFNEKEFIYQMAVNTFWRAFDYDSFDYEDRVARFLDNQELKVIAPLMSTILKEQTDNPAKERVLGLSVRDYSDKDVNFLANKYTDFYLFLAQKDSRMLNHLDWLAADKVFFMETLRLFLNSFPKEFDYWEPLVNRILVENVSISETEVTMMAMYVPSAVFMVLERLNDGEIVNGEWVAYCKSHPQDILTWMKGVSGLNRDMVRIVIDTFDTSSETVRRSDTSAWKCLLHAEVDSDMQLEYSVFLFELSYIIAQNDDAFVLYKKSFMTVYEATMRNKIGIYWIKIGQYCPTPFLGLEWDRCDMLRKGFAERLWNEQRSVEVAKRFTSKRSLNKQLYKVAQKRYYSTWP
jgi:hypothetical protein